MRFFSIHTTKKKNIIFLQYRFIFLLQYCLWKLLVWRGPNVEKSFFLNQLHFLFLSLSNKQTSNRILISKWSSFVYQCRGYEEDGQWWEPAAGEATERGCNRFRTPRRGRRRHSLFNEKVYVQVDLVIWCRYVPLFWTVNTVFEVKKGTFLLESYSFRPIFQMIRSPRITRSTCSLVTVATSD